MQLIVHLTRPFSQCIEHPCIIKFRKNLHWVHGKYEYDLQEKIWLYHLALRFQLSEREAKQRTEMREVCSKSKTNM